MRVSETIDFPTRTPEGFDQILHNGPLPRDIAVAPIVSFLRKAFGM